MIIGLTGKKQHGKDTTGAILVEDHGYTRVAYADALKESAAAIFGINPEWWNEYKNDPEATVELRVRGGAVVVLTIRQFLQRYGTEAHREIEGFGDGIWVEIARARVEERLPKVVVTDVRFNNEAALIREMGGIVVEVYRPEIADDGDAHKSEDMPEADMMLWNGEGIEELRGRIAQQVAEDWKASIV